MKIRVNQFVAAFVCFAIPLISNGGSDEWIRQNLLDMNMGTGPYAPPPPLPETRELCYHVINSSGSRIEDIYIKPADSSSWSTTCIPDGATMDWINSGVPLMICKSSRSYGSVSVSLVDGGLQRDLFGNTTHAPNNLVASVPVGDYDGYAYRMKVCWTDGSVREFYLPYPWGDVSIYRNQAFVYLGVSGRGLFYKQCIDPQ